MNRTISLTPLAATRTRPIGIPPGGSALAPSPKASPASAPLLGWGRTVVVAGGLGFLLARPALWAVPGGTVVLAGGYLVLLAAGAVAAGRAQPGPSAGRWTIPAATHAAANLLAVIAR
jgi:hypothetical protein